MQKFMEEIIFFKFKTSESHFYFVHHKGLSMCIAKAELSIVTTTLAHFLILFLNLKRSILTFRAA